MKFLTLQDLNLEDSLALYWKGTFAPHLEVERALESFFQAFEQYAGEWLPDFVKGKRRRKYTRAAVWKSLEERRDNTGARIGLSRSTYPWVDMVVSYALPPIPHSLRTSLHVQPLTFFSQEERCLQFAELVRAWSSQYPVPYAKAHSAADAALAGSPN